MGNGRHHDDTVRLSAGFLQRDADDRKHLRRFSELSAWKQLISLLTLLGITSSGVTGALLWAADQKLDQKYATDEDLQSAQAQMTSSVDELKSETAANTVALKETARSVDSLTLAVIDIQIRDLANDIATLEREQDGNSTRAEAAVLRDKRRALADLETQRSILFQRAIDRATNRNNG